MARIAESVVEQLKREVSLVRLVEARGVALSKHGARDLIGRCPFHADGTPSLVVSPDKNLWHCLGACQSGGSVVDWVMKAEGVSFRHAVTRLRAQAGLSEAPSASLAASPSAAPGDPSASAALLDRVVGYYHRTLKASEEAQAFLQSRGLEHPELVDHFRLGFANRTLAYQLPKKTTAEGKALRAELQALGVLRATGHEHFNGSLVVPIEDASGRVVEMYGRKVTRNLRKGTPNHLYLPGPHAGVWNLAGVRDAEQVILCEALLDAMTFWCAGFRHVTSSYGTSGFTKAHVEVLREKEVLIAYDRDDAGDRAAEAVAAQLGAEGCVCHRVRFPKGMDANAYAQTMQPAKRALGLVLKSAEWMTGARSVGSSAGLADAATAADTGTQVDGDVAKAGAAVPDIEDAPPVGVPETSAEGATKGASVSEAPDSAPVPNVAAPEPVPSLEASPLLAAEPSAVGELEVSEHQVVARYGDRRYRVRGLAKNQSYDILKVNLLLAWQDKSFPDQLDLYAARQRAGFVRQAAGELGLDEGTIRADLGRLLLALEAHQEAVLQAEAAPKVTEVTLTEAERKEALALLEAPDLIDRILRDFDRAGIVGENTNKLVGYLACTSRKLERPLAILVQSSSAAGKSSLMDAVLSMMPEEAQARFSAMTGQALYYLGETELKHKILAIAEEEGAERAAYALKLLQSEGELTIASTGKDPDTGRLITRPYHVEGPVMLFLTTTAVDVDEELANRCLVLTVDEGTAQTEAIHRAQRARYTLDGVLERSARQEVLRVHRNAQRLLRRLPVVNPLAPELTFTSHAPRTRRDHTKYLDLIATLALLHQYQREVKTAEHAGQRVEYIEATEADVALANRLAEKVLARSLDELPPQTRKLLEAIHAYADARCRAEQVRLGALRFRRRELREVTGWSNTQLHLHLGRLVDMEYLIAHHGRNGQAYVYEVVDLSPSYGKRAPMPTADADAFRGQTPDLSGGSRGAFRVASESLKGLEGGASRVSEVSEAKLSAVPAPIDGRTAARAVVNGD